LLKLLLTIKYAAVHSIILAGIMSDYEEFFQNISFFDPAAILKKFITLIRGGTIMQRVPCTEYPVVGQLISKALVDNQKIHRATVLISKKGRLNVYYLNGTFLLEADTDGDHNPNDYYFFKEVEDDQIRTIIAKLSEFIGGPTENSSLDQIVNHTLAFLRSY